MVPTGETENYINLKSNIFYHFLSRNTQCTSKNSKNTIEKLNSLTIFHIQTWKSWRLFLQNLKLLASEKLKNLPLETQSNIRHPRQVYILFICTSSILFVDQDSSKQNDHNTEEFLVRSPLLSIPLVLACKYYLKISGKKFSWNIE